MNSLASLALIASLGAAAPALANPDVRVVVTGVVENNHFTSGTFAGIPAGAPVTLTIDLDSINYLDSAAFPGRCRGYRFYPNTSSLTVGPVTTTLRTSPQPAADFCVRNNDPGVDGFFISQGTDIDTEIPLQMVPNNYGIGFLRTFNNVLTLPSVNILDAFGSWGMDNISVYSFAVHLGEFSYPMIFIYQTISVQPIPCAGGGVTCDLNQDGATDFSDVFTLMDGVGGLTPCPSHCGCDLSQDGAEDFSDVFMLIDIVGGLTACP